MTAAQTTDAFGHPTHARQGVAVTAGASSGVYAAQAGGMHRSVSADVRTLRYSNADPATVLPWQDSNINFGLQATKVSSAPFISIYASSSTRGCRLACSGGAITNPDLDDHDLSAAAQLGARHHLALDLNRQTGRFHSLSPDIASGTMLVDNTIVHPGWTPGVDNFDSVLFASASAEASATLPWGPGSTAASNIGPYDNINDAPVPEPAAWALTLAGLCAAALARRRPKAP